MQDIYDLHHLQFHQYLWSEGASISESSLEISKLFSITFPMLFRVSRLLVESLLPNSMLFMLSQLLESLISATCCKLLLLFEIPTTSLSSTCCMLFLFPIVFIAPF
ncbi:hypothetical protein ACOSP7_022908 [Xanthoceras sorbifolium]